MPRISDRPHRPGTGCSVAIRYEQTALPAVFHRAPRDGPRPLVIVDHDGERAGPPCCTDGALEALRLGYHWMTFDGPGRRSALHARGLISRPDWEAVLTPVLDAMLARPEVDAERVVVIGAGEAGYGVARALAFEHRFAAAVLAPAVVDLADPWMRLLSQPMRMQLENGERETFDREMRLAELLTPRLESIFSRDGTAYGIGGDSHFDLYRAIGRYRLHDEVESITTPLLLVTSDDERRWSGQSHELARRLSGPHTLLHRARGQRASRPIFAWLEEQWR
jgi:hypothetical protein